MKRLAIQHSSLDKQAPEGVHIIVRLVEPTHGRKPPVVLGDYTTVEAAQQASDILTSKGVPHGFLTWWQKDGRHVKKWPTLMQGKRRNFKVSVPYTSEFSDEMIRVYLREAILSAPNKPVVYNAASVRVGMDVDANRLEADSQLIQLRLPLAVVQAIQAMPPGAAEALIEQAIIGNNPLQI